MNIYHSKMVIFATFLLCCCSDLDGRYGGPAARVDVYSDANAKVQLVPKERRGPPYDLEDRVPQLVMWGDYVLRVSCNGSDYAPKGLVSVGGKASPVITVKKCNVSVEYK